MANKDFYLFYLVYTHAYETVKQTEQRNGSSVTQSQSADEKIGQDSTSRAQLLQRGPRYNGQDDTD